MPAYVVLLRAVNVGGTGRLPMKEFTAMCEAEGYAGVHTYIASGNAVFRSLLTSTAIQRALGRRLATYAGKPVGVLVRTAAEMAAVLAANPFPKAAPNRVMTIFLDAPPTTADLANLRGQKDEVIKLGKREIYVHYGNGMGQSKLVIPAAKAGTARNLNTVAKLAGMSAEPRQS
jgi:uncharacterized protein (DUF1697 family)